jgi:putative ATPase
MIANSNTPLAERLRPKTLDEYIGQKHLVGDNGPLRKVVSSGYLPSLILWGPPGVGKTTLAFILAQQFKRPFYQLSAVNSGVKEVREVLDSASNQGMFQNSPILFIDEIHRFSKSQQDSLLAAVEKGVVTLIGATTENPSFEVISALLSRCQVYTLEYLSKIELDEVLQNAIEKDSWLASKNIEVKESEALIKLSGGDARKLLSLLEIAVNALPQGEKIIDNKHVTEYIQQNPALYDKSGEMHYDVISAFIKSIRGSDPNAAVYWLARMIEGGEDPKFIARRLLILSSEDIGNANPTALIMANNCFQAVNVIGWPESRIILAQCVTYLASSPKSNASYVAINDAQKIAREKTNLPVPLHLRNAPTKLMKELGYGKDYMYSHTHKDESHLQEFMPECIENTLLYKPGENQREQELKKYLNKIWKGKYDY